MEIEEVLLIRFSSRGFTVVICGCPLTGTRLGNLAQERKGSTGRRPINSCRECKKYGVWSRDRCNEPRSVRRSRRTATAAKSILTSVIAGHYQGVEDRLKKLDSQMEGPYKILGRVGNDYRLVDLPPSIKVHPIIAAARLSDPVPGQHPDPPPPIEVNGEAEWEVEKILASRLFRKKTLQYRAKWVL